ncbi:class I SAM-dependent DNA methyltransferase [Streptomyces marincola]|uniref:class I SAM-dependent DNA methyltransferase n=1 Tax=Streptomyces marincola TaxID=2878388 RepID=UPI001CF31DE5|nr:class I SAM-dependent methyltransferase [Streptomyces marincola]UCM87065.1 class I SAM-dependent methyltransferase [Streptomyces marincola]
MGSVQIEEIYRRADVYDAVYKGRGKDYAAEARLVTEHIRRLKPDARSLLDVACGTGSHLVHLVDHFDDVTGLDRSAEMVETAARRVPGIPLHQGDMRDFRLPRQFDAVTCLFSSVGYLPDQQALTATLATFARHTTPGGVVVIEPWWSPANFLDGHVSGATVHEDGRTISRVSRTVREGGSSRMEVHYTVADPKAGIAHFTDTHVMTLFTHDEYQAAFRQAGFSVDFMPYEHVGPGLFVGVLDGGTSGPAPGTPA